MVCEKLKASPPPRRLTAWRRGLLLIMASTVFAMGARRPDRVRCGADVAVGNRGECQWRVEPDRIAYLPSRMEIVLAECRQASTPELRDSHPCAQPDPQTCFLGQGGVCAGNRIAPDVNLEPAGWDLLPGARAHRWRGDPDSR